jgi:Zn-dependent protease with chaperone function
MILISLHILDFATVTSNQKIIFIRIGLIIISIATLIFYLAQFFSVHTLEIILPDSLINQFTFNSIHPITIKPQTDWTLYIYIAYVVGFLVALCRILFSYFKSSRQLACSKRGYIQGQSVFLSKNIQSPLSFGFPKGKIYFPVDTEKQWTTREIEMCLAHEKIHINQKDNLWKLHSLIVQALLFFAPWAYFLHRKFEFEMEIFCDGETRSRTKAGIQEYGSLLLTMTSIQPNNFIFTNIKTSTLKRRLLAMKSKNTHRPLLVSVFSAALLLAGGMAIASDGVMNKSMFKITSKIFINGQLVSSPQIVAYENQKATITLSNKNGDQDIKLALIAKDNSKDSIKINYDFQYNNGNDKMHSKPEMILVPNQEGVIRIASDSNHSYEMKVIAERQ